MRITARGIGLLVAAAVLLGTGFGFGYVELTLLGAAATVAAACAIGYAAWRPRLAVHRTADPDRVGRGEPAAMTLTVRNRDRLRAASLVAEDRCGSRRVAVPLLKLRPGRDTVVRYPVPTHRRGVITVGPLLVTGEDALGLVRVARSHGGSVEIWVHPRVHHLAAVPSGVARSLDGRIDRVPHGSITFDSLREYVVGDELRRVHWRTSARIGELMVREHVDTSLPRIVVLLDNRAAAHPDRVAGVAETFESACEAAASVVVAARRDDLPVTLALVAPEPAPTDTGTTPADANFLDRLAAVELRPAGQGADDPLRATTNRLRQERLGDTLVFLTGPGAAPDLGYLGGLRGAYPSVVVGMFGAAGVAPAAAAGMVLLDVPDGAAFAAEWDGVRRW
ncbi:DUF58 domain-containing protein [Solwaraspora sp. WMMD1047]|uniref:DUF58 domain-containing protein n=1 Tax=Solwaraspora sp. WMMD1047 TaxID=3016102 RepID=UPI0024170E2B|nr:DUF58 domain-containing protein [Solwaraspora sp. WMMD1047]MDG4831756.1 DUF58 domain-containing protein [Solwaraspora sp. WMMD1047]